MECRSFGPESQSDRMSLSRTVSGLSTSGKFFFFLDKKLDRERLVAWISFGVKFFPCNSVSKKHIFDPRAWDSSRYFTVTV